MAVEAGSEGRVVKCEVYCRKRIARECGYEVEFGLVISCVELASVFFSPR